MRASKSNSELRTPNAELTEVHISGAEGIYEKSEMMKVVREYIKRALNHPRGKPDKIVITVEEIKQKPQKNALLSVKTLNCKSPDDAKKIISDTLSGIGISKKAMNAAFKVLTSTNTMRGASLIFSESGKRAEPDKKRGVRVSRLGIDKSAQNRLARRLSRVSINTSAVKEALMLASKVASHPDIVAEICISDDPDYTTGYISSRGSGYMRIPNIKNAGERHGGRVFFIKEYADIGKIIEHLEKTPVILYYMKRHK